MINTQKKLLSRIKLIAVYSFFTMLTLSFNLASAAGIVILLIHAGYLSDTFYESPIRITIYIFAISLIIGLLFITIFSKLMLRPLHHMIESTKKLSNGDFNTHFEVTGLLKDTELSEFAEAFNLMAKELSSIEMLRSDFINNFSHEFKTPIVSIRGFAHLLKDSALSPEDRTEYIDIIIQESDRLTSLATNVLNLSKVENQSIVTEYETYCLSEQIRNVLLILEAKWTTKELELDVALEEINFTGNKELLSQVFLNIIDNAIKFSPKGAELAVSLKDHSTYIEFQVQDYGCGMDKETQLHIFDKFYQGNTLQKTQGNGIGMTIVAKIIELHRGNIHIKSKEGQGTQISIHLPK